MQDTKSKLKNQTPTDKKYYVQYYMKEIKELDGLLFILKFLYLPGKNLDCISVS